MENLETCCYGIELLIFKFLMETVISVPFDPVPEIVMSPQNRQHYLQILAPKLENICHRGLAKFGKLGFHV